METSASFREKSAIGRNSLWLVLPTKEENVLARREKYAPIGGNFTYRVLYPVAKLHEILVSAQVQL